MSVSSPETRVPFEEAPPTTDGPRKMLFGMAGRVFLIEALDDWSAQAISRLFSGWSLTPLSAGGSTPEFTIRVGCGLSSPNIPAGMDRFDVADGGACHTDGQSVYLELDGSLVVIGPLDTRRVEVWIRTRYEFSSWILAQVLSQAFAAALRRCGLFLLHSAGVLPSGENKAVLIAGESGSGKSTLTFQLAARDWGYLSDDSILLINDGRGLEAKGLRRFFALTTDTLSAFQFQETTSGTLTRKLKKRVAPDEFFPGRQIESAPVGTILFPAVTHERKSRLKKLDPYETMTRLLRLCPWSCYDKATAGPYLEIFGLLARDATAFDLFAGKDLLGDPELTADLISRTFVSR